MFEFDKEELEKFIYDHVNAYSSESSSWYELTEKGICMTTHFMINGKTWSEKELVLKGKNNV